MSVIGEATSEFFESPDPEELAPYEDHFHPETARKKASSKSPGQPMHAVTTVPYAEQVGLLVMSLRALLTALIDHSEGSDRLMGLLYPTFVYTQKHTIEGRDRVSFRLGHH